MEVDNLFENLTIKEIKQQNIKTRTEIERKKEELRFLVSERYRDIIDAADTIFEMKSCASDINESIKNINSIYKDWNNLILHKSLANNSRIDKDLEKKQRKLSLVAQIKLILNMSELIWNSLESEKFSKAAMLFNICRNMSIHSQLMSDKYKDEQLDLQLIISRHWSSLSNLEETIGQVCRNYLKSTKLEHTTNKVLDSLLGILLLEDKNISFALEEYLNCVEHQIKEWFSPKNSCLPIGQQLDFVAEIIMKTISNVYQLFMKNELLHRLNELSSITVKDMECTQTERVYRHLPDGIALFKPAQKCFQCNSDFKNLVIIVTITSDWLKSCRNKYQSSFVSSFKYLTTVKSVGDIRLNLEKTFDGVTEDLVKTEEWNLMEIENSSEWKSIIKIMHSTKLKEIIEEEISSYFATWSKSIEKFMETNINLLNEDEFDGDSFFNYFWTEFNKDVFFNAECSMSSTFIPENSSSVCKMVFESLYFHFLNFFDIGSSASNKSCSFESMVVKFKAVRPEIYQITRIFNSQLLQLLEEVINTINDNEAFLWILLKQCLASIVDRCAEWVNKLVGNDFSEPNATSDLLKHEKLFYDFKNDFNTTIVVFQLKMIILSQSIRTIYELLPAFQAGFMTSVFNSENVSSSLSESKTLPKRKSKNSRLPFLPGRRLNHQQDLESAMWNTWNEVIEPLKEIVNQFIVRGTKSSIFNFVMSYFQFVKFGLSSTEACDEICTKWSGINLTNSELNNGVTLPLEVPTQCSWPMHILLFNVSHLLSLFGVHSITGKSSDGIRLQILKFIIDNFNAIKESDVFHESKCIQKQNIQLIFDLRFLLEIINAKAGIEKDIQDNLRSMLNDIEKCVDPFDYEMMSEALHQNLTQNIAKNSSLYWLLSSNQPRKNQSFGQKLEIGTSQHNLIDLVGTVVGKANKTNNLRFGMLPVSGYTLIDKSSISNSPKLPSTIEHVPATVVNVHSKTEARQNRNFAVNLQPSNKSYFGRLGTNWF